MHSQKQPDFVWQLGNRRLISISGEDAAAFLQNIITNDIRKATRDALIYSCLLSPQGQFLHDFFIFSPEENVYWIDIYEGWKDNFIKRLLTYKLRAKVSIGEVVDDYEVYTLSDASPHGFSFKDPRLAGLGFRVYSKEKLSSRGNEKHNTDHGIALGVAEGYIVSRNERDFPAELNLDGLNAIDFNKGCFVGQEVAARIEHKGLVKKRLFKVDGADLESGGGLSAGGKAIGEMRCVNARGDQGLALVRVDYERAEGSFYAEQPGKTAAEVTLTLPAHTLRKS